MVVWCKVLGRDLVTDYCVVLAVDVARVLLRIEGILFFYAPLELVLVKFVVPVENLVSFVQAVALPQDGLLVPQRVLLPSDNLGESAPLNLLAEHALFSMYGEFIIIIISTSK